MVEFKTIVLTTDLSENAKAAVPYAMDLARKYGGTVTLLHVCEDPIYYAGTAAAEGFVVDVPDLAQRIEEERRKMLGAEAHALEKNYGVHVVPVLRTGHPVQEILEHAKSHDPDVLVVATHGRTGLAHLVFGSVAEKIIRLSPCPVLSIRPEPVAKK
jgi:nucleotide-binding universal stress UspA family protein